MHPAFTDPSGPERPPEGLWRAGGRTRPLAYVRRRQTSSRFRHAATSGTMRRCRDVRRRSAQNGVPGPYSVCRRGRRPGLPDRFPRRGQGGGCRRRWLPSASASAPARCSAACSPGCCAGSGALPALGAGARVAGDRRRPHRLASWTSSGCSPASAARTTPTPWPRRSPAWARASGWRSSGSSPSRRPTRRPGCRARGSGRCGPARCSPWRRSASSSPTVRWSVDNYPAAHTALRVMAVLMLTITGVICMRYWPRRLRLPAWGRRVGAGLLALPFVWALVVVDGDRDLLAGSARAAVLEPVAADAAEPRRRRPRRLLADPRRWRLRPVQRRGPPVRARSCPATASTTTASSAIWPSRRRRPTRRCPTSRRRPASSSSPSTPPARRPRQLGRQAQHHPEMKKWSESGTRFIRAYTGGSWTSLALSSLFRGVYPRRLVWNPFYETNKFRLLRSTEMDQARRRRAGQASSSACRRPTSTCRCRPS